MKNKKSGFTLVELLAVIVILAVILTIAIPNVISSLDKSRRDTFVADAKKFLSLARYEIGNKISKPASGEIVRINLACVDNEDLVSDPDGNPYDEENSFVAVVRKDDELVYYVHLMSTGGKRGVYLTQKENLDKDERITYVKNNVQSLTDAEIKEVTGVSGNIRVCQ